MPGMQLDEFAKLAEHELNGGIAWGRWGGRILGLGGFPAGASETTREGACGPRETLRGLGR